MIEEVCGEWHPQKPWLFCAKSPQHRGEHRYQADPKRAEAKIEVLLLEVSYLKAEIEEMRRADTALWQKIHRLRGYGEGPGRC